MSKRIFISSSFEKSLSKRKQKVFLLNLAKLLPQYTIFSFIRDIEQWTNIITEPKELMSRAKIEISKSQYFYIDVTDNPRGRRIEAGIAFGLGVPIILTYKKGTPVPSTTMGIAQWTIEYSNQKELCKLLANFQNLI